MGTLLAARSQAQTGADGTSPAGRGTVSTSYQMATKFKDNSFILNPAIILLVCHCSVLLRLFPPTRGVTSVEVLRCTEWCFWGNEEEHMEEKSKEMIEEEEIEDERNEVTTGD